MVTIQVNNLIDFVAEVFSHSESSPEEARRIATYLTTANLTGHDSHGVIRVPVYIRWKKTGNVVPNQTPEIVVDTPSLAVVDGKFGYGQTVTPFAVRTGIEKCKKAGLSASRCATPGISAASATGRKWPPPKGWCRSTSSMPRARCWWRRSAASRSGSRPRPIASAFRARGRIRSCSISPPRSSPKARCWWQAAAARNCRPARSSTPTAR